jgi:L-fuculose-phosphate aldolase
MPQRGLGVGTVGSVSARVGDRIRITPSRMPYDRVTPRDLNSVDLSGRFAGRHAPSCELPLHLAIYLARPDVHAVVHTHSACATAWSCLGERLSPQLEETAYYSIGPVRTSEWAPAGSAGLAAAATGALGGSRAVLLARHGVVAVGDAPEDALMVALAVEHIARVALIVRSAANRDAVATGALLAEQLR